MLPRLAQPAPVQCLASSVSRLTHQIKLSMDSPDVNASVRRYNTRLGLALFAIYLVLYLGFVLVNAFAADLMDRIVLAGLNLAIVSGFGLILVAVLLALVYGGFCRSEPRDQSPADGGSR